MRKQKKVVKTVRRRRAPHKLQPRKVVQPVPVVRVFQVARKLNHFQTPKLKLYRLILQHLHPACPKTVKVGLRQRHKRQHVERNLPPRVQEVQKKAVPVQRQRALRLNHRRKVKVWPLLRHLHKHVLPAVLLLRKKRRRLKSAVKLMRAVLRTPNLLPVRASRRLTQKWKLKLPLQVAE